MEKNVQKSILCILFLLGALVSPAVCEEQAGSPVFKAEELEQILAPIALYPDSLISQILMASTYPLEVVQAERWTKQNQKLSSTALTAALEKETWDPSVKSLVNFPEVLTMMSEKLDWMQKLGDAFLAQQKEVMATIQRLRKKAKEQANLKTTEQQIVKEEQDIIIIEPADPQVIYVPTYDPVVVYGAWPYPAYPPYYYYPPGYVAGSNAVAFGMGFAAGAAWGWAWGGCNWHGGDIDIDIDRHIDINHDIHHDPSAQHFQDRGQLDQNGKGKWQHNPENRKGVAYRDSATAQKYNRAAAPDAVQSREQFRGRAEQGRQDLKRGDAGQPTARPDAGQRADRQAPAGAGSRDFGNRGGSGRSSNAFQGMERGRSERSYSQRGSASRQGVSRPSGSGGGGLRGGGRGRR